MPSFKSFARASLLAAPLNAAAQSANFISTVAGTNFTLTGESSSYMFKVNEVGDLVSKHFGGIVDEFTPDIYVSTQGWHDGLSTIRREFPDVGRSDPRLPAIHIQHADGNTVSAFTYKSHEIMAGKPALPGLPSTYGEDSDVSTLLVHLYDNYSDVAASLSYSIFPKYNAIARSFQLINNGTNNITIQRAASFSTDLPNIDLEMIELHGDWSSERQIARRKVDYGETTFRSTDGYSSHTFNPFFALVDPSTTETTGEAWGFNLIYTGSFAATTERYSNGFVRVLLGLNPLHASIPVAPGETFTSPEAVAVYSAQGLGGMSRSFHDLYRNHLSRSNWTHETRPVLLNSWEGLMYGINESSVQRLAEETAALGIKLLAMDDGWFGKTPYARINDTAGLADWEPNPEHFPNGLGYLTDKVNAMQVNTTAGGSASGPLSFGLWVEPEMVNPNSTFYHEHPDWAMHAGNHYRSLTRNQLVLNVALPEVQDFIIDAISNIIDSANITYIKWDNNRAIHEMPNPGTDHKYILGLYRVIDTLTTKYPDILWEGCASGGGRFDPGLLHYWPQSWTSDNTDASDRLHIQIGTSFSYPLSSMGCHVSAIPNGGTHRNISIAYRAAVASMCGSFGFELNPEELSEEERLAIPGILERQAKINPIVISGEFYRLVLPQQSNWPAVQFVSQDGSEAVLFAFQQMAVVKPSAPPIKLQGLDSKARYFNNYDNATYTGATYMNGGLNLQFNQTDYQSRIVFLNKV